MDNQLDNLRSEMSNLQMNCESNPEDSKIKKEYSKALRKAAFEICELRFNQVWAEEAAQNMESDSDEDDEA